MGSKYREYSSDRRTSTRDYHRIHPIWRGVGFTMMVLIPIISYAAADVLLKQNGLHNWFPLPLDLLAQPGQFLYKLIPDPMINIKIILFVVFMFLLYLLFMIVSFIANSAFGATAKRDPYYVPPVRRRPRRRLR